MRPARGARAQTTAVSLALHVVPGLEDLASRWVGQEIPTADVERAWRDFDERTSLLPIHLDREGDASSAAEVLLTCPLAEDVFATALRIDDVPPVFAGLHVVRDAVAHDPALTAALDVAFKLHGAVRRVTYRVICRTAGRHSFRRVDLQRAVEHGVTQRFPSWRLVEDAARLELWVVLAERRLWLGVRLSDAAMRHRSYLQASLPAALKPTVARAMVVLSRPTPDDVFLDPMCGSGTILLERAASARHARLLGGDLDPAAVDATVTNVGPRHKPISLQRWDARQLPLRAGSVTALVCNLPFGRQVGTAEENRRLYPALQRLPILLRGLPTTIYVIRRVQTASRGAVLPRPRS